MGCVRQSNGREAVMETLVIGAVVVYLVIKLWKFVIWLVMMGVIALVIYLQFLT